MGKRSGGFLFGILAGTALGILFAPKKGKRLRDEIKREREEGGYGLESVKDGFVGMGKEMVDSAKEFYGSEEVQEGVNSARERATAMAAEVAEEGKRRVRKAKSVVKSEAGAVASKAKKRVRKATKKATKKAAKAVKSAKSKAKKFTKRKISK